jgi:hypothetical protein
MLDFTKSMSFNYENLSCIGFDSAQPDRQLESHTERSRSVFGLSKRH